MLAAVQHILNPAWRSSPGDLQDIDTIASIVHDHYGCRHFVKQGTNKKNPQYSSSVIKGRYT
jgi:hypothetical protein